MKVVVGISGGVDSAVAAYLLLNEGYDVIGLFMKNWDSNINNDSEGMTEDICPQELDYIDAKKACDILGIPLYRIDFIKEYWESVFTYFLEELKKGRTPNPDIMCNKYIKFDLFLKEAKKLGADKIATGHYARKEGNKLLRAVDLNKDQTYFLSQVKVDNFKDVLFPIGNLTKTEVRKIAKKIGLNVADKKDSTGICFIGERHYQQFVQNYIKGQEGDIVNVETNEIIGKHNGLMNYTIGQRRGLHIGGPGEAWFVCGKDTTKNQLIVGQGKDTELLYANRVIVTDVNIINGTFSNNQKMTAKFRYRQPDEEITVSWVNENTLEVKCSRPVKAITPGQACVFYDGEYCLGGGTIDKVYMDNILRKY